MGGKRKGSVAGPQAKGDGAQLTPLTHTDRGQQYRAGMNAVPEIEHVSAADVGRVDLKFLWDPYLPKGHMILAEGDEGVGKSFFVAAVVADLTGGPRIAGGRRRRPGLRVLYLPGEESLALGVVPRLEAAGAVKELVSFGPGVRGSQHAWRPQFPGDFEALKNFVQVYRPALIVMEPLVSFFGPRHDWRRDQDAHAVLDPLVLLAAEMEMSCLGVRHWTKAGTGRATARGMGSRAVSGCHDVVLQFVVEDERPGTYAMLNTKHRLCGVQPGRNFRIEGPRGAGRLLMGQPTELRLDEVQPRLTGGGGAKMRTVREFLRKELKKGVWTGVPDLVKAVKGMGISDTILYDAKAQDGIPHRMNTQATPKHAEWTAPEGGFPPLDG